MTQLRVACWLKQVSNKYTPNNDLIVICNHEALEMQSPSEEGTGSYYAEDVIGPPMSYSDVMIGSL